MGLANYQVATISEKGMSILVDEEEPLIDVDGAPFELRDVKVRKDRWVTDDFTILDFLGRGKFGEVKRCKENVTSREFAAKFICAPRPQDKREVEHEVNIMKKLQHKRLLQLYDCYQSKGEMCIILEIIYGGELFDRVIDEDFILTEKACIVFMRQICEGVDYMHNIGIIHLDMKPENILCLTRVGNRVKIIDFGLAREFDGKKEIRVLFGTPEFMAPEVVQYDPIGFGTDMWSLGVICYVLLSGLSPFMGDTDTDTLSNVISGVYDFDYEEFADVSDSAKDMIRKLLQKNKKDRLCAAACLDHPWLKRRPSESPTLQLSKRRLKRFVYRRKWQKVVNAIIALKRMGVQLASLQKRDDPDVKPKAPIFRFPSIKRPRRTIGEVITCPHDTKGGSKRALDAQCTHTNGACNCLTAPTAPTGPTPTTTATNMTNNVVNNHYDNNHDSHTDDDSDCNSLTTTHAEFTLKTPPTRPKNSSSGHTPTILPSPTETDAPVDVWCDASDVPEETWSDASNEVTFSFTLSNGFNSSDEDCPEFPMSMLHISEDMEQHVTHTATAQFTLSTNNKESSEL